MLFLNGGMQANGNGLYVDIYDNIFFIYFIL